MSERAIVVREKLIKLASGPESANPVKLWKALDIAERIEAARAALAQEELRIRQLLIDRVATQLHFRPAKVATFPLGQLSEHVAGLIDLPRFVAGELIRALHLEHRRELLVGFLNDIGLSHQDGVITDEGFERQVVDMPAGRIAGAAERLIQTHDPDKVVTYLLALYLQDTETWREVGNWLRENASRWSAEVTIAAAAEEGGSEAQEPWVEPDDFTTLDVQLFRVVADVAQGVEGALTHEQLDDLIDELIHLNSSRHRTYFHAGLRDSVLDRPVANELEAENVTRRRWYLAGYIQGLGRRGAAEMIATAFSEHEAVRQLGVKGDGAAQASATLIFEALCETGRPAEAVKFLSLESVVSRPQRMLPSLLTRATALLRGGQPQASRAMLELMAAAAEILERDEQPVPISFLHDMRRRLAHCYRELGDMAGATDLLEDLLRDPQLNPTDRSRIIVDIGLVHCGFQRLADLRLPRNEPDSRDLRSKLIEAESSFREALEISGADSGHARFVLGMLRFYEENWERAMLHLDEAVSTFEREPEVYRSGGLLANARLALALAICRQLEYVRLERAGDLLKQACDEGLRVPQYLVGPTLEALEIASTELARNVGEALMAVSAPVILDVLLRSPALHESEIVADAVLERACDECRTLEQRTVDYRAALPLLNVQQRRDDAGDALDALEDAATRGVGVNQFLQILDDEALCQPGWELDDVLWSRVHVLESSARYDEAAFQLEAEFHRVVSGGGGSWDMEAEGILERISGYGLAAERAEPLRARLDAQRAIVAPDVSAIETLSPSNILVVGGNETQAQYDDAIRDLFAEQHAHVTIDFLHSGWSSNWNKHLADVERRLPSLDGIVLMRHMRTQLGRRIRAACAVPWRTCVGTGQRAIVTAILAVDAAAQPALRRQLEAKARETEQGS